MDRLDPEKVAYWYFRLNGFLQLENFVVHPERRGSQRTDADLLAVRFPFRAERLFDDPNDIMLDDFGRLALSGDHIDVVIAEVKKNQPCTLNGPWTKQDLQNVHRVIAAIGCLPAEFIEQAATDIYRTGIYRSSLGLQIRLVAVGRAHNNELAEKYPAVKQMTWHDILAFIWNRFRTYRQQKTQVDQWDGQGLVIKHLADVSNSEMEFRAAVFRLMDIRDSEDLGARSAGLSKLDRN